MYALCTHYIVKIYKVTHYNDCTVLDHIYCYSTIVFSYKISNIHDDNMVVSLSVTLT